MDEILPGVFHWVTRHPRLGQDVSSYFLSESGVLIDPFRPADGLPGEATAVVLSCRHHLRDATEFGVPIHANRHGLHEFPEVDAEPFDPGDELPGGILALEVGSLCPDESGLLIRDKNALVVGDGVVRAGGPIGFVPDQLMDDPEQTRRGLLDAYERILDEHRVEHLLMAHGGPIVGEGGTQLRDLVNSGGRAAFEL